MNNKDISKILQNAKNTTATKPKKEEEKAPAPKVTANTSTSSVPASKPTQTSSKPTQTTTAKSTQTSTTKSSSPAKTENKKINPNSPEGIKAIHGKDVQKKSAYEEIPSLDNSYHYSYTPEFSTYQEKNTGNATKDSLNRTMAMWNMTNTAMNTPKNLPSFDSEESLKSYYESIPEYNAFERMFSADKKEKYNQKQALSSEYQRLKNIDTIKQLYDSGITEKDIRDYVDSSSENYWNATNKVNDTIARNGIEIGDVAKAFADYNNDLIKKQAKQTPISSTAFTFATNPVESVGGVGKKIYQYATGNPITKSTPYTNLARNAISEDMSGVGKFAYNTGTSVGDMLTAMALAAPTGGNSLVSAGIMGVEKADQTMNEAIERGLMPGQVIMEGVASGVTTALTEKIPMDKFSKAAQTGFRGATGKQLAKEIGKVFWNAGFPEAIQEMSEDGADLIADWLIAGDKSQINFRIRELEANGLSHQDAETTAWKEWIFQTGMDGLSGLLSGGTVGDINASFGTFIGNNANEIADNPVDISTESLQGLGYTPEEIEQIQRDVLAEELPGMDMQEEMPTVDDAVADLIQNPVEDNVLNDEELLPLDLFENEEITNEEVNNIPIEEIANDVVNELDNPEEITNADVNSIVPEEQNAVNAANPETELFTDENVNESGDKLASLVENELNNTPQNPNNDLASVMDSYVNEQQGNQNIPQVNPESTYTSENITVDDLNGMDDVSDIRERGYNQTLVEKTDAPASLKAQFVNNPTLYRQLHNPETLARANEIFENNSLREAYDEANRMIKDFDPAAVPLAYKVANELSAQGEIDLAVDLTNNLEQNLTKAGQFTQAVVINMLNQNPLAGREYMKRKIDALNNEGAKRFGTKWENFELTEEESALFDNIDMGDTDAINDAYGQIWSRIAKDIPVTNWQKLQELRRISLLCNMRTIVRNLASNAAMLPLRWNAGRITALAEYAYQRYNPNYTRTEAVLGASKKSRALAQQVVDTQFSQLFGDNEIQWQDTDAILRNAQVFKGGALDKGLDKVLTIGANLARKADVKVYEYINKATGGTIDKVMDMYGIENIDSFMKLVNGDVFGKDINPSVLESIRNFTYFMLGEFGDTPFVKANFKSKLASYIEANHIENIEDIPQDAIMLAVQEANKATFHDESAIAEALQGIRKNINKLTGPVELGNLILTFAKTPGNIATRMLEYSPAGLLKSMGDIGKYNKQIKTYSERIDKAQESFDNAETTAEKLKYQKELNRLQEMQADSYQKITNAFTLLGQGLEGTLGILVGYLLGQMGITIGKLSSDKRKRKYQQNVLNMQDNSVQIGNTSYSYDFLQPALSPVQFGVIIGESFKENQDSFWNAMGQAGVSVADSWFNSTPMKSFSEMFSGNGTPTENIMNMLMDIPTSWIPSQVGAVARIEDRTMRNTYDNTSKLKTVVNEGVAKIPGLSKTLPASYDLWGRERERQDTKDKAMFAQLINPGTTKTSNKTEIDDELLKLYDSVGDEKVFPHGAAYSYTIGNETYKLDNRQNSEYQKILGSTSYDLAKAYVQSDAWKNAPDSVKVKGLDEIYSFAEALSKRDILGVYPQDKEKLLEIYDKEGIDGIKNYFNERLSYQSALGSANVDGNATTQKIYDNLGQAGVDEYAEAQRLAEEKGASKVTEAEWEMYRNGNMDGFNKSVNSRVLLENNGIDVTEAKQKYIEKHGEGGIYNLKEAEQIVKQIQKGTDSYGNPVYRSLDSTMLDVYDTYGVQGLRQYKDAVNSAIAYGANNITTDEWKTYQSGDKDAFAKMVSDRIILENSNLPNTKFYRDYIDEYGVESIPVLKEASDAIVQIQSGTDKYGDAKYFSPNEKLLDIYKSRGKQGVQFYADIYTKDDIDGDPSSRTLYDTVPYLESLDMPEDEKGYWLSYFVSGKRVNNYLANNDYAGLYRYYSNKY